MHTTIVLPDLGGGDAVLGTWLAVVGEPVYEGDAVAEVLLPGATFLVPAPATGRLAQQLALPNDALTAGQVLGVIELVD